MKRYKIEGDNVKTDSWGWDKNPVLGVEYTFEELKEMYGKEEYEQTFEDIFENWEDSEWEPRHGKWIVVK